MNQEIKQTLTYVQVIEDMRKFVEYHLSCEID